MNRTAQLDSRLWRFGVPLLMVVVVAVTWIVAVRVRNDNPGGATLLRVEIPGERVFRNRELQAALAGDVSVGEAAVWAALCNNTVEWDANISLDPRLVVATRPDLTRAAELLATGRFDHDEVARIERHVALEAPIEEELVEWVSIWGSATAREYASARFEEPSVGTHDRFVVYATSRSTTDQYLVFTDLEQLDDDLVRRVARSLFQGVGVTPVLVAGDDEPRTLDAADCGNTPGSGLSSV